MALAPQLRQYLTDGRATDATAKIDAAMGGGRCTRDIRGHPWCTTPERPSCGDDLE
jgi:hypothetical protein